MKRIIYGFLLCSAGLMAVSCGKDNTDDVILGYTTDKTLAIVKIDLGRLDEKLPKDEIMKDKSNKFSDSEKEKMQLFMNADDNGIDIEKPLYVMTDQDKNDFAFSFIGWLDNPSKFEKNFSKITDTKVHIDKAKNLVYSDDNLIGSIKDDMIVLSRTTGNPMSSMGRGYAPIERDTPGPKFYEEFWKRKPTEKQGAIDQIEKSLSVEADISTWVNLYGIVNTASKGYIETLAVNKLLLDAGIGMNLNFGNGSIEFKTNTFFNEELQKLVKKYYDNKGVDYNIVKNIDLADAKMYSIGFVSIDFVKYFIKEAGFEPIANQVLEYKGLTVDDITGALDGSYAFATYGEEAPADDPYAYAKPSGVLALGINSDKAGKLINLIETDSMFSFYAKTFHNKELLVFATDDSQLELLKSGKAAANKDLKKTSGINSYTWMSGDSFNSTYGTRSKVKILKMESTSKIDGGNGSSETVITLNKDKKNALHYIMGYE